MKIKRFLAPDMRTALQHVRQEHGPDAVILSNRVTPEGVEIVAASQYDEALVRDAAEPAVTAPVPMSVDAGEDESLCVPSVHEDRDGTPVAEVLPELPPAFTAPAERTASPALASLLTPDTAASAPQMPELATAKPVISAPIVSVPTPPPAEPPPPPASTPTMNDTIAPVPVTPVADSPDVADTAISAQLREEFALMRQMLERGLNRMTDERLRCSPALEQLMDWMEAQGFTAELTRDVALAIPADSAAHGIQEQATALLAERLPISPANFLDEGGAIALVGPSGVGKTSTVGKLAAYYSARHGVRDIALISLDHARPGGSDRLYCLARQLGIAAHEADSAQALATLLQRLQDYRVVLIDCPGVTPRHPQAAEQLNWLRNAGNVRSLLVLPANTHHVDLDDVVNRFQPAEPQGVIVTRLDETRRPGSVLSVIAHHRLPLTWVSDGQHLHDDLHRADAASVLQRLSAIECEIPVSAPYDPVAALVAKHAFA